MLERDTMDEPRVVDSRVISYHMLRNAIGIIGILLPFVLIFGKIVFFQSPGIQDSISSYYYTEMRDVLVGSLCAIGVFLFSYKGYDNPNPHPALQRLPFRGTDDLASTVAGVCAIGVALFPTQSGSTTINEFIGNKLYAGLHVLFAAGFFLALAFISIWLFPKHHSDDPIRKYEPLVYRLCGAAILVCIALIVVVWALPSDSLIWQLYPVLLLESGAILAFSISWFTKGKGYDWGEWRKVL
jgi:hypothetical protein